MEFSGTFSFLHMYGTVGSSALPTTHGDHMELVLRVSELHVCCGRGQSEDIYQPY